MPQHEGGQILHVVRGDVTPPLVQGVGPADGVQGDAAPGAAAQLDVRVVPGGGDEADDIARHLPGDHHPLALVHEGHDLLPADDGMDVPLGLLACHDDAHLVLEGGVADGKLDHKAVDLGLRQLIGAQGLDGVLGGQHHVGPLQGIGVGVHCHLPLLHDLQHGRLGLRRGPVDLVGQHDVAHGGAGAELELPRLLVVDGEAAHVGGHDVGGELDALVAAVHRFGQSGDQAGLAHAGDVLDEDVAPRRQGQHRQLHDLPLAGDDRLDVVHDVVHLPAAPPGVFLGQRLIGQHFRLLSDVLFHSCLSNSFSLVVWSFTVRTPFPHRAGSAEAGTPAPAGASRPGSPPPEWWRGRPASGCAR